MQVPKSTKSTKFVALKKGALWYLKLLPRVHNREESVKLQYASAKMCPSSTSVYSSVFTYNPYVLTSLYRHLSFMALIRPHQIVCFTYNISISTLGFGDNLMSQHAEWIPLNTHKLSEKNCRLAIVCSFFKPFNIMLFSNIT